jgi:hypothetical protein
LVRKDSGDAEFKLSARTQQSLYNGRAMSKTINNSARTNEVFLAHDKVHLHLGYTTVDQANSNRQGGFSW